MTTDFYTKLRNCTFVKLKLDLRLLSLQIKAFFLLLRRYFLLSGLHSETTTEHWMCLCLWRVHFCRSGYIFQGWLLVFENNTNTTRPIGYSILIAHIDQHWHFVHKNEGLSEKKKNIFRLCLILPRTHTVRVVWILYFHLLSIFWVCNLLQIAPGLACNPLPLMLTPPK